MLQVDELKTILRNRSLGGYFPNLPSHCFKFESTFAYIFSQFSLIVLMLPHPTPLCINIKCLHLPVRLCGRVLLLVGLTNATIIRILRRHAATGTLVPGKPMGLFGKPHFIKTIHCFVEDGTTGLFHKCSGLHGTDEEFGQKKHQHLALVSWLPWL